MGFQFDIPTPNPWSPPNPFAKSNYIGWILSICTTYVFRNKLNPPAIILIICGGFLSMGFGWTQAIPVIGSMRFPYRMYLLVLIGIAVALSELNIRLQSRLSLLVLFEFTILSPIDQIIPNSSANYPSYVDKIDGPILELPGILHRQPGTIDPSRPRMKRLMYYQTSHQQPSVWSLSFNGLNQPNHCFAGTQIIDQKATAAERKAHLNRECWSSVNWVVLHNDNQALNDWLKALKFTPSNLKSGSPQIWHRQQTNVRQPD